MEINQLLNIIIGGVLVILKEIKKQLVFLKKVTKNQISGIFFYFNAMSFLVIE